jgi:hypothetical protein
MRTLWSILALAVFTPLVLNGIEHLANKNPDTHGGLIFLAVIVFFGYLSSRIEK